MYVCVGGQNKKIIIKSTNEASCWNLFLKILSRFRKMVLIGVVITTSSVLHITHGPTHDPTAKLALDCICNCSIQADEGFLNRILFLFKS